MIQIAYSKIGNERFARSYNKITNCVGLEVKEAYAVKKLTDKLEAARKAIREEYQKEFVEVYGARDEQGKIIYDKESGGFKVDETKQEAFNAAEKGFDTKMVTIDRPKLSLSTIYQRANLTPTDLSVLEDVLDLAGMEEDGPALKAVK